MKISHRDFIFGPYKKCPNPQCLTEEAFGVVISMGSTQIYTRECIKCGYHENFALPSIKKKILYLDQFVISNLVKLLDKSHPSHTKIKADPFWENLFIKLEIALKSQVIVCPDSLYHRDESLTGNINFKLMEKLYKHFSNGKTFSPRTVIEGNQIIRHFKRWLEKKKSEFEFRLEDIAYENLHTWNVGLRISLKINPYLGEIDHLQKTNTLTKEQLEAVWTRWRCEQDIGFVARIKEETLGVWKGRAINLKQSVEKLKSSALEKNYNSLDDSLARLKQMSEFETLIRIAQKKGVSEPQILETIVRYFNDVDSLLEIPIIRIASIMFAGLAHKAAHGKKRPPKSVVDVQFISSYLPYCDALFVDKESALLLREFPKNAPSYLRLQEFPAKVFSFNNKGEFLDYLDQLIDEIPSDQISVLKDMVGENYADPYWNILEDEKRIHCEC